MQLRATRTRREQQNWRVAANVSPLFSALIISAPAEFRAASRPTWVPFAAPKWRLIRCNLYNFAMTKTPSPPTLFFFNSRVWPPARRRVGRRPALPAPARVAVRDSPGPTPGPHTHTNVSYATCATPGPKKRQNRFSPPFRGRKSACDVAVRAQNCAALRCAGRHTACGAWESQAPPPTLPPTFLARPPARLLAHPRP